MFLNVTKVTHGIVEYYSSKWEIEVKEKHKMHEQTNIQFSYA